MHEDFVYLGWAVALGALSAVSLPLGSLAGLMLRPRASIAAVLAAFGAGALIAALAVELVAPTVEAIGEHHDAVAAFWALTLGALAGGFVFVALDRMLAAASCARPRRPSVITRGNGARGTPSGFTTCARFRCSGRCRPNRWSSWFGTCGASPSLRARRSSSKGSLPTASTSSGAARWNSSTAVHRSAAWGPEVSSASSAWSPRRRAGPVPGASAKGRLSFWSAPPSIARPPLRERNQSFTLLVRSSDSSNSRLVHATLLCVRNVPKRQIMDRDVARQQKSDIWVA